MSPENGRERKKKARYTFVVLPEGDSDKTRTFSASVPGLVGTVFASFLVIVFLILAAIVYTPIGSLLPIANPELEQQYAKQISDIQTQIGTLLDQMSVLRGYNLRLRKAMGEEMHGEDSVLAASGPLAMAGAPARDRFPARGETSAPADPGTAQGPQHGTVLQASLPTGGGARRVMELPFLMPSDGYVSRGFDPDEFHYGVDLAGAQGTAVLAAAGGSVVFAGWTYDDGLMMMISHDMGYLTVYKHNKALLKIVGTTVRRGEPVALLGNTGRTSSGPHLHFEIWRDGNPTDPMKYLVAVQ
jgi:murein DD-endopeptidase MepM/ murein hydrolase activator NlpD